MNINQWISNQVLGGGQEMPYVDWQLFRGSIGGGKQPRQKRVERDGLQKLPYTAEQLTGTWIKDFSESDNMKPACDLVKLKGVRRQAAKLMHGVRVKLQGDFFQVDALTRIPLVKVSERYKLDGSSSTHTRRDMRGKHTGHVEVTRRGVQLHLEWGEPCGGTQSELYTLTDSDVMVMHTEMVVGGETLRYKSTFRKR